MKRSDKTYLQKLDVRIKEYDEAFEFFVYWLVLLDHKYIHALEQMMKAAGIKNINRSH